MPYFLFLPLFLIKRTGRTCRTGRTSQTFRTSRTSETCRTCRTCRTSRTGPTTPTLSGDGVPILLPRNRVLRLLVWAQAAGKTAANRPFRYRR